MNNTDKNHEVTTGSLEEATPADFELTCIYNAIVTNELAFAQLTEAIGLIKNSAKYQKKTKQETNRLEKYLKDFEKRMTRVVGSRIAYMSDVAQIIQDECQVNTDQILEAMTREFGKVNHSDPAMMASIELARTYCELAVLNLRKRMQEMKSKGIEDYDNISWLDQTKLLNQATTVCELLFEGGNINLNKNLMCKTALCLIERKLTNCKLIATAINESDKLNPAQDLF